MYKEDPQENPLAEYHEVTYGLDTKSQEFVLLDLHGWWDHEAAKPQFNTQVLRESHKSEDQASAAMDERIQWLDGQGWRFKLTADFNPETGAWEPMRI